MLLDMTSNPRIARCVALLTIATLFVQPATSATCSCSDRLVVCPAGPTTSLVGRETCCSTRSLPTYCGQQGSAFCQKTVACCCKAKQVAKENSRCCQRQKLDQKTTGKSCMCGPGCSCRLSKNEDPQPMVPAAPAGESVRQVELALIHHSSDLIVVQHQVTAAEVRSTDNLAGPTALDRCIELSRFTC